MNDGTLSTIEQHPAEAARSAAPRATATTMPSKPRSLSLRLFATSSATARARGGHHARRPRGRSSRASARTWCRTVTTASTAAESRMFWTLPSVRNCGLSSEKTITITTSAIGGPASRKDTPRRGRGRAASDVLGGGCQGHDSGPATRLKTLAHSKSAGSVFGVEVLGGVVLGDEELLGEEGAVLVGDVRRPSSSPVGHAVADRQADAALPRAVARDGRGHGAVGDGR